MSYIYTHILEKENEIEAMEGRDGEIGRLDGRESRACLVETVE